MSDNEEKAYLYACSESGADRELKTEEDRKCLVSYLLQEYAVDGLGDMFSQEELSAVRLDEETKDDDIAFSVKEDGAIDLDKAVKRVYRSRADFVKKIDFDWFFDEHEDEVMEYYRDAFAGEHYGEPTEEDYEEDAYEERRFGLDAKAKDEPERLSFGELVLKIDKHNREARKKAGGFLGQYQDPNPLHCVVVFSNDNVKNGNWKPGDYSLESRSYEFRSDEKYFLPDMAGGSIFAESLDGEDHIRLDRYLDWVIDYCYIR